MEQVVLHDRISGLPEPILHHILSFLLTEEAVKVASTCKTLNQVFAALPYLDLGDDFLPALPPPGREKLFTFVEKTLGSLRLQDLTVHKFRQWWTGLDVDLGESLDRWIDYLVHCNIKELVLGSHDMYELPPILLTTTSLRALTLSRCRMPLASLTLPALQKLSLHFVYLHEKILLDIINNFPYLEDLELDYCMGLGKRISLAPPRHSRLRYLMLSPGYIEEVGKVVIEAHNLEKLWYVGIPGRPTTINIITNTVSSLKDLSLSGGGITNTWFCELISRLPCLEKLRLSQLNLKAIEISSSSLKRLTLSYVFRHEDIGFGEFKIDTPNLVSLVYSGSLSSVFQNSLAIKNVRIMINGFYRDRRNEHFNLMQFLQKFDLSEVVIVGCAYFEFVIFPMEVRSNLHTPLAHIKHLVLEGVFRRTPRNVIANIFKSVQLIAPNLDSLSLKCDRLCTGDCIELVKFTVGQCDCSTSPSECLKKCRSRTKIEVKGVGVEADALRNRLYRIGYSDYWNPWKLQRSMA